MGAMCHADNCTMRFVVQIMANSKIKFNQGSEKAQECRESHEGRLIFLYFPKILRVIYEKILEKFTQPLLLSKLFIIL
jgi:hypothetical protein